MIPDNVTLIVKAPNQQIDDQNIECQSTWTVRELKAYLSDVYPNKPSTDEQKIIYSGQLLEDNVVLKDILRTYESQIAHTMHLVCTPKRRMAEKPETLSTPNSVLRQRIPDAETPNVETATRPEMRQNDQNHTVEMQNYLSSFVNNYGRVPPYSNYNLGESYFPVPDPALANQMMMMQQAYLQYMQQYANMWQATNAVPNQAPETPQPVAETPAPQAEDIEEGVHRDWLDHLYAASRLAILFSLVYLYGSPARFLLVVLLAAAGYLHQIGFFRDLHLNPVNDNRRNEQNPHNPQNNPNPPNNPNPRTEPNRPDVDTPVNDNQQSLLSVTWMIFTSFFASLIPDANH